VRVLVCVLLCVCVCVCVYVHAYMYVCKFVEVCVCVCVCVCVPCKRVMATNADMLHHLDTDLVQEVCNTINAFFKHQHHNRYLLTPCECMCVRVYIVG
jgi:predicted Co/Zn/Cd cation transporter (cation efflux family)